MSSQVYWGSMPVGSLKENPEEYTDRKITELVNNAPETLDTLKELADALGNNPDLAGKITTIEGNITNLSNNKADKTQIPTKVSQLANDSNYAKVSAIPTKVSQLNNDSNFVNATQLAAKADTTTVNSQLSNKADKTTVASDLATKVDKPTVKKPNQWLTTDENGNPQWVDMNMIDLVAYGVEWDVTSSSPICKRVGNILMHKNLPIQEGFRGCVHNGGKVAYYLDADDWSKKEDGTASVLDGTDGDVGVDTGCTFYGRSFIDGNKRRVYVSQTKIDSSWEEIPRQIIDAWHSTIDTTDSTKLKARCVVNTTAQFRGGGNRSAFDQYLESDPSRTDLGKPRSAITRATMRQYAFNNGKAVHPYQYYKWIKYWLYVIEYANFNAQAAYNANLTSDGFRQGGLGNGVTTMGNWSEYNNYYSVTPCGYTNDLGNHTGVKNMTIQAFTYNNSAGEQVNRAAQTISVARWRGFQNPFGDVWNNLDCCIGRNETEDLNSDGTTYKYLTCYRYDDPTAVFKVSSLTELNALGLDSMSGDHWVKIGKDCNTNGYVKTFDLGLTGEIIPSAVGAGITTYKCDYHYTDNKGQSPRTFLFGGSASNGAYAGPACLASDCGVGSASTAIGLACYSLYKS